MANMQRTLDLSYDEIIIGSDLSALCYSYINNVPILYIRQNKPNPFDIFEGDKLCKDKWEEIMFFLSLHNLSPFGDNIQSIRLSKDNILKVITKQNFICNISYKTLIISDDYKVNGLPSTNKKTNTKNLVIDWFKVLSGRKHKYDLLKTNSEFVQTINFQSDSFGNKNLYCFSYLKDSQILKTDYSEAIARIKTVRVMKKANIVPDTSKKIKVEHIKREIYPTGKNVYENLPENIKLLLETPQEIMKKEKKQNKYLDYLERLINGE